MVQVAVNPLPERGMRSSLDVGLSALGLHPPAEGGSCFVMPVDCTARVFRELDLATNETLVPLYGDRSGHPVRLGAEALRALGTDDAPLDRVLARCGVRHLPVEDAGVLSNLNHSEDWRRLAGAPPVLFSRA